MTVANAASTTATAPVESVRRIMEDLLSGLWRYAFRSVRRLTLIADDGSWRRVVAATNPPFRALRVVGGGHAGLGEGGGYAFRNRLAVCAGRPWRDRGRGCPPQAAGGGVHVAAGDSALDQRLPHAGEPGQGARPRQRCERD